MAEGQQRTILLGIDNSSASETACQWAVDNLIKPGDTVHLLNVVEMPAADVLIGADVVPVHYPDPAADRKNVEDAVSFINAKFVPRLKDNPYKVEVVHFSTAAGAVGEVLCERAKNLDAAALVMASHSKGAIHRFFLGSSTDYCAKHSSVPLVITH